MKQLLKIFFLCALVGQIQGAALDADVKKYLEFSNPILTAVQDDRSDLIEPLVYLRMDPNQFGKVYTPLLFVISSKKDHSIKFEMVKKLIQFGADVHQCDVTGRISPLYASILFESPEIAKFLLNAGAQIEDRFLNQLQKMAAQEDLKNKNTEFSDLIQKSLDVTQELQRLKIDPKNFFQEKRSLDHPNLKSLMFSFKDDITWCLRSKDPIFTAIAENKIALIEPLIKRGFKINISHLNAALYFGEVLKEINTLPAIETLIKYGLNVNLPDGLNLAPLYYAFISHVNPEIIKYLLNVGAQIQSGFNDLNNLKALAAQEDSKNENTEFSDLIQKSLDATQNLKRLNFDPVLFFQNGRTLNDVNRLKTQMLRYVVDNNLV